jgi:hypothetical protein
MTRHAELGGFDFRACLGDEGAELARRRGIAVPSRIATPGDARRSVDPDPLQMAWDYCGPAELRVDRLA